MRLSRFLICALVMPFVIILLRRWLYQDQCRIVTVDGGHFFEGLMRAPCERVLGSQKVSFTTRITNETKLVIASVFGDAKNNVSFDVPIILISGEAHPVLPISGRRKQGLIDTKPRGGWSLPHLYLPFYVASFGERRWNKPSDLLTKPNVNNKSKFCAYLASYDTDDRCRFFDVLTRSKRVDGLGASRNNTGVPSDRNVYESKKTYMDLAVDKYRPYRFVITFENKRHPGYITEKIVSAMLAGCVPIYYGAPDIVQHFNAKSFVNVADFASFEQCRDHVLMLENNPVLLAEVQNATYFSDNRLPHYFSEKQITMWVTLLAFVLLAIGCFVSGWHFKRTSCHRQICETNQDPQNVSMGSIFASPLYVLNLERRTDRREEMLRQVSQHPQVFWIKAVDGKSLIRDQLYPDCKMTPGQIGCFMSHVLAWEALVKSSSKFGTIVEDDVFITYPFDFVRLNLALQAVEQVAGQSWDVISVGYLDDYKSFYENLGVAAGPGLEVARLKAGHLMPSGMSYILKARAAVKLLKNIGRACWPVDHYISDAVNGLKIFATSPSAFGPNEMNSSDMA